MNELRSGTTGRSRSFKPPQNRSRLPQVFDRRLIKEKTIEGRMTELESDNSSDLDQHSGRTRVTPVLKWLQAHGGDEWPTELLRLADGIKVVESIGKVISVVEERTVAPSPERLAWMIRNAHRLAPVDGRQWQEYRRRVIDNPQKAHALATLDTGSTSIPQELKLEGNTHADCLIECERACVWIEGKRNDWLSPSITWDVTRDQLARNLEASWLLSKQVEKDFWFLICHEYDLKHHEQEIVQGYRAGTWKAGLPHVPADVRRLFQEKIGTLKWGSIFARWPDLPKS
jgi:hypothetical protein